jgi:hypothetical protein
MKIVYVIILIIVVLIVTAWLGLQVKPKPFAFPDLKEGPVAAVPLPTGLPEPVDRFYRTVYGDQLPVIKTVVITGRARIKPFGIWLPARFVFVHSAGKDYRHYFEAMIFGIPFLKINEGIISGRSFFESPMGNINNDPNTNQGANLALWAEAIWFPSIWVTDPRTRWQAVDDNTALLFVPYEKETENFLVRFNPQTHLVDLMESMRYRDAGEGKHKILWIARNVGEAMFPGTKINSEGSATWLDQGTPWAYFTAVEMKYNVDSADYIRRRGSVPSRSEKGMRKNIDRS